jgi:thiamine-monophosphate kinase
MLKVSDIGEARLIKRISQLVGGNSSEVKVGIGDDAAVVKLNQPLAILTTDLLVEDVHFKKDVDPAYSIGYRSLIASISDVAAMAGKPRFVLVSLAIRNDCSVDFIDDFYRGLLEAARKYKVEVVGGDLSSSKINFVSLAVLGQSGVVEFPCRNKAKPGDKILVTGSLGSSTVGRLFLHGEKFPDSRLKKMLINQYLYPQARLKEAQLAVLSGCHVLEDISDGLDRELENICQASQLGACLDWEKLPLSPGIIEVANYLNLDPYQIAISSGEEYELLIAIPPSQIPEITSKISGDLGTKVTEIGEFRDLANLGITANLPDGSKKTLLVGGWKHFENH